LVGEEEQEAVLTLSLLLVWSILGLGGRYFVTFMIFTTFRDPFLTDANDDSTHAYVRVLGICSSISGIVTYTLCIDSFESLSRTERLKASTVSSCKCFVIHDQILVSCVTY
jgi:hypothetical protein